MRRFSAIFAIPELEKYSDDEFVVLMRKARLRRGDALWVIPALWGFVGAVVWVGVTAVMTFGLKSTGLSLTGNGMARWIGLNVFVGLLVAVAVGAAVRWWMLVRSIRRLVNKAGCPYCEFSMVGLRVSAGWVRCPECGERVYIFDENLTEEDLMTDAERYTPPPGIGAGEMGAYIKPERIRRIEARRR
ncbi:MAG TPA: hypothetical protein PKE29_10755 [Phycisphaerales bacterium]|nr:hypothetical protein [Phycisphaerales bacterium]